MAELDILEVEVWEDSLSLEGWSWLADAGLAAWAWATTPAWAAWWAVALRWAGCAALVAGHVLK